MAVKILVSKEDAKYLDVFAVLLLHYGKYTMLPEFYDVFGLELLEKFLDVFAGRQFTVPTFEKLEQIVRDVDIYVKYKGGKGVSILAERYNISERWVHSIFEEVRSLIDEHSIPALLKELEEIIDASEER